MAYATHADPISRVREIGPILRRNSPAGEAARALTPEAHEALVSAGVFDLARPRSLGGEEVELLTFVRTLKEAARANGSAGCSAARSGWEARRWPSFRGRRSSRPTPSRAAQRSTPPANSTAACGTRGQQCGTC